MPRDLFAQPLFSPKLLKSRFAALPVPEAHRELISEWHQQLKGGLSKQKEEAIRPAFLARFFGDILGYQQTVARSGRLTMKPAPLTAKLTPLWALLRMTCGKL